MSDAIKELRDYLAKSPSVVYPQDVLEYLPAIESENAKLRELLKELYADMWALGEWLEPYEQRMRELGVEVDG